MHALIWTTHHLISDEIWSGGFLRTPRYPSVIEQALSVIPTVKVKYLVRWLSTHPTLAWFSQLWCAWRRLERWRFYLADDFLLEPLIFSFQRTTYRNILPYKRMFWLSPTDIHRPLIVGLCPSHDWRGSLLSENDKTFKPFLDRY